MSIRTEPVTDAQARALIALASGPVYPGNGISYSTARALSRRGLAELEVRPPAVYVSGHGRTRYVREWILRRNGT